MRKLLLLTAITLMASCQKDYYLEDLNKAQQDIENLTKSNQGQLALIASLQETINDLTSTLLDTETQLDNITIIAETRENEIIGLTAVVDSLYVVEEDLLYSLGQASSTIDLLETDINTLQLTVDNLNSVVETLNDQIEYLENNPITITVTETVVEIRYSHSTTYVEVPADITDAQRDQIIADYLAAQQDEYVPTSLEFVAYVVANTLNGIDFERDDSTDANGLVVVLTGETPTDFYDIIYTENTDEWQLLVNYEHVLIDTTPQEIVDYFNKL